MLKINKKKFQKLLSHLKYDEKDRTLAIILESGSWQYLKHRAIEAIQANDYILAVKLLLLLCYSISQAPGVSTVPDPKAYEDLVK